MSGAAFDRRALAPGALLLIAALAVPLAACGGSSKHATTTSAATHAGGAVTSSNAAPAHDLTVHLSAPQSEPKAGGFWPITVTATSPTGRPVEGTVSYAYLFGSAVVARRPGGAMHGGVFHDRMEFPARAVGYPLTVEVIVKGQGERGSVTRPVKVEP
jgi:hypothetical protein